MENTLQSPRDRLCWCLHQLKTILWVLLLQPMTQSGLSPKRERLSGIKAEVWMNWILFGSYGPMESNSQLPEVRRDSSLRLLTYKEGRLPHLIWDVWYWLSSQRRAISFGAGLIFWSITVAMCFWMSVSEWVNAQAGREPRLLCFGRHLRVIPRGNVFVWWPQRESERHRLIASVSEQKADLPSTRNYSLQSNVEYLNLPKKWKLNPPRITIHRCMLDVTTMYSTEQIIKNCFSSMIMTGNLFWKRSPDFWLHTLIFSPIVY